MAKVTPSKPSGTKQKMRPALTPDSREQQLISLAIDLVEQRLIDGTASSQETTHFLKLASSKARLEKTILEKQAELYSAKTESIKAEAIRDDLFKDAIAAMKSYSGHSRQDDSDDY